MTDQPPEPPPLEVLEPEPSPGDTPEGLWAFGFITGWRPGAKAGYTRSAFGDRSGVPEGDTEWDVGEEAAEFGLNYATADELGKDYQDGCEIGYVHGHRFGYEKLVRLSEEAQAIKTGEDIPPPTEPEPMPAEVYPEIVPDTPPTDE